MDPSEPGAALPPEMAPAPPQHRGLLVQGPILPLLAALTWPVLLSMGLQTLFYVIDAAWVGRLGPDALAAVTTSVYATWILGGLGELLAAGVVALAAREIGAGRPARAQALAVQALVLALLLGVGLVALAPFAPAGLFQALATAPAVSRHGIAYLTPLLYLATPGLLLATFAAIFRAWGDTRTALRITFVSVLLNVGLDPLFIFGPGPLPAGGVAGAAWATLVSQTVGVLLFLHHFRRRFGPLRLSPPERGPIGAIVRIGLPVTLNAALYALVYLWFAGVAARIGTNAVATVGVGNRLESAVYILAESLSLAAAAFVGQNRGAGRLRRALHGARWALALAFLAGSLFGALFFWNGRELFAVFTSDPALLEVADPYMRILGLCQGAMAVEVTLYGVFAGAGYTLVPAVLSAAVHLLRIPLASWIALHLGYGLDGLAWMITLTCVLRALCLGAVFLRGHWLRGRG